MVVVPATAMPRRATRACSVTAREKETGKTWDMEEVGVYTVADDRIVREEFFYAMS